MDFPAPGSPSPNGGNARVVALLPAHNEALLIAETIASLMAQTVPFDYVVVIANNCTDDTVQIVRSLQLEYGQRLRLLDMPNNRFKKAGALNAGYQLIAEEDVEFVFSMDADTVIHPDLVKEALQQFAREPHTGGICSGYRTLAPNSSSSRWQRLLWRLQNIEYGLANAWRIENQKSARVLPGVAVMFRMATLHDVSARHQDGTVWAVNSLVEDYRLTLEIKELGWDAKSSLDMVSWSDVPLRLNGKGGLWDQRQRWYSGTIDELRLRGTREHSRYELFTVSLLMVTLFMRVVLFGAYGLLLVLLLMHDAVLRTDGGSGSGMQWYWLFWVMPLITAGLQLYRLRYIDQVDNWQRLMTATLVLNELYAFYREVIYAYGIWLSYRRPHRAW